MVLSTECSKCKSAMPNLAQALMFGSKMKVTGYLCPECGHWNNLKRRKWFRAQLTKRAADVLCTCGATPVVGGAEVCLFCGLPKVAHR